MRCTLSKEFCSCAFFQLCGCGPLNLVLSLWLALFSLRMFAELIGLLLSAEVVGLSELFLLISVVCLLWFCCFLLSCLFCLFVCFVMFCFVSELVWLLACLLVRLFVCLFACLLVCLFVGLFVRFVSPLWGLSTHCFTVVLALLWVFFGGFESYEAWNLTQWYT